MRQRVGEAGLGATRPQRSSLAAWLEDGVEESPGSAASRDRVRRQRQGVGAVAPPPVWAEGLEKTTEPFRTIPPPRPSPPSPTRNKDGGRLGKCPGRGIGT